MISPGALNDSKRNAVKLIREVGLLGNFNIQVTYPNTMPGELRPLSYEDAWKKCKKNSWFDIELDDSSLLIFKSDGYSYVRVPFFTLSFTEFAADFYENDPEWEKEENKHIIAEEYEKYLDSQLKSQPPMPVRFDIDSNYYCKHTHPLYHFHFGIENESRIPSNRELTPISFTGFILRTFYPKEWKIFAESKELEKYLAHLKGNLSYVSKKYWKAYEAELFYLG
ncbi:DUF2290 domain-containing protein [Pectobacterium brasiliense]|uniref:DUF2290 domain-containing protein n=1 Tax=Pectobacterium brasiliense TaxID=180957 RepID=UPI0006515CF3|nr:DUF2290 domain-containing protein [Pectobacterium brasiliense]KMK84292.1 hypothetical protein KCO_09465 [Pectobacterium brasiliense ICMP 19477]